MKEEIAIKVENLSKDFKIPHEKVTSIRSAAVGVFSRKRGYEEFKALDDVSFEVKKGEFFGIIGRNGSGKSTLLKILAGIYQPDKGNVHINGRISPFLELGIGFNPELSGRDNVYLNATVLGLTKKQIDKKFDSIVAFSELERFIDQKLKNYSSGMKVRLAFSVSIHANREILLMDEVLAVGDTNFQSKCITEFNRYREMGKTVILVSHDIGTIQRYCDRAMLLRNGKIVKIGKAEDVGSAYVYDNMSDEEKRIAEEKEQKLADAEKRLKNMKGKELAEEMKRIENEKVRLEEERKNKVAEIKKVEFLDKDGNEKNVFETGDDVLVRVYFKILKEIKEINFGIAIYNQEGDYIFGVNTFTEEVKIEHALEKGYFEIKFGSVPIRTSGYFVKIGVWGNSPTLVYDFLNKSDPFQIFSKDKNQGMINIDYNWK